MAIEKCKDCGSEVSTTAKTCPSCGCTNPTRTAAVVATGTAGGCGGCLLIVIGLVIGLVYLANYSGGSNPPQQTTSRMDRFIQSEHEEQTEAAKTIEPPEEVVTEIPKNVTYIVVQQSTVPRIKRAITIRLNRKVSEGVLRSIAMKLKESDRRSYERTFIAYFLPHMELGHVAWATTHFNPDLEVRIQGFTLEQDSKLIQNQDDPARKVIGSWIDDRMHVGNRSTLFRHGGKLFLEKTFPDGSRRTKEIIQKLSTGGKRFEEVGGHVGDFFLIDEKGNLQLWDQDGLISTALKVGILDLGRPDVKSLGPAEDTFTHKTTGEKLRGTLVTTTQKDGKPHVFAKLSDGSLRFLPTADWVVKAAPRKAVTKKTAPSRGKTAEKPVQVVKRLYLELLSFKDEAEFVEKGFAVASPYHKWLKSVDMIKTKKDFAQALLPLGVVPGDLSMLGLEYMTSRGKETNYSKFMRRKFDKALKVRKR